MQDMLKALRHSAIRKLARREHSRKELRQALCMKYPDAKVLVEELLDELVSSGYLNEDRFAEAYIRYRRDRGYGPIRIKLELEERGVPDELIEQRLDMADPLWQEQLVQVRNKRFGSKIPKDLAEKARQIRFLQYRGFDFSLIKTCF